MYKGPWNLSYNKNNEPSEITYNGKMVVNLASMSLVNSFLAEHLVGILNKQLLANHRLEVALEEFNKKMKVNVDD